jgi:hypothetical protein
MDPLLLILSVVLAGLVIRLSIWRHKTQARSKEQPPPYGSPQPVGRSATPAAPIADELLKLHALKTSGALTEREFAEAKAKLLNGR